MTKTTIDPDCEDFIERMGLAIEADGLPRIAGRMFGYFLVYGGVVSFSALSEILQVSRGSISTNARLLANLGVLEQVSRPGDRQNYYQLSVDPGAKMISAAMQRLAATEKLIAKAGNTMPASITGARDRLRNMARFYQQVGQQLSVLLDELDRKSS